MKRRIIKGQGGINGIQPLNDQDVQDYKDYQASLPETGMQKAARYAGYAMNPVGAASDYATAKVQRSRWAPNWLKRIFPWVSNVMAMAGMQFKRNGNVQSARNTAARNTFDNLDPKTGKSAYLIDRRGFHKRGRGPAIEGGDPDNPTPTSYSGRYPGKHKPAPKAKSTKKQTTTTTTQETQPTKRQILEQRLKAANGGK